MKVTILDKKDNTFFNCENVESVDFPKNHKNQVCEIRICYYGTINNPEGNIDTFPIESYSLTSVIEVK